MVKYVDTKSAAVAVQVWNTVPRRALCPHLDGIDCLATVLYACILAFPGGYSFDGVPGMYIGMGLGTEPRALFKLSRATKECRTTTVTGGPTPTPFPTPNPRQRGTAASPKGNARRASSHTTLISGGLREHVSAPGTLGNVVPYLPPVVPLVSHFLSLCWGPRRGGGDAAIPPTRGPLRRQGFVAWAGGGGDVWG